VPRPVVGLDIETVGQDWETLSPRVQTYLSEASKGEPDVEAAKERLSLHAATGRIVAIGLWDLETDRGRVLVDGDRSGWAGFGEHAEIFRGPEAALVGEFWNTIAKDSPLVVTFNGRAFDAPYLMLRSAILGVPPSRNLMGPRYRLSNHCDLYDVLTFWRASRMKGGLEFWCCQFGLPSSKDGMQGGDVGGMYRDGRLDEIARYCLDDARVTAQLYDRLRPLISILDAGATL
jgi:DNA polymerase elongation subunit (family B)